jgi:hypothetical protein
VWTSERLAIAYFVYLAVVCWLRPLPIRRRVALAAIASFEIAAIRWIAARDILFLRQWAPLPTILIGYYASGLLFVAPSPAVEAWLMAWDRRLLGDPSKRFAQWPRLVLAALEIAYMGCFVLIGGGLLILLLNGHAAAGRSLLDTGGRRRIRCVRAARVRSDAPALGDRAKAGPCRSGSSRFGDADGESLHDSREHLSKRARCRFAGGRLWPSPRRCR